MIVQPLYELKHSIQLALATSELTSSSFTSTTTTSSWTSPLTDDADLYSPKPLTSSVNFSGHALQFQEMPGTF
jgi:hypothetical protein